MGTANRDYALLVKVFAEPPYPALIVAGAYALEGLTLPPNVRLQAGSVRGCLPRALPTRRAVHRAA